MRHVIDNLISKEDFIDSSEVMRSRIKLHLSYLNKRTENIKKIKQELNPIIVEIEAKEKIDIEEIKYLIREFQIKLPHKGLD